VGLTNPHSKNFLVTKIHKKPRTWTDSLDNGPKQRKMDMIFGTSISHGSMKDAQNC
jgi:hypothetical protein